MWRDCNLGFTGFCKTQRHGGFYSLYYCITGYHKHGLNHHWQVYPWLIKQIYLYLYHLYLYQAVTNHYQQSIIQYQLHHGSHTAYNNNQYNSNNQIGILQVTTNLLVKKIFNYITADTLMINYLSRYIMLVSMTQISEGTKLPQSGEQISPRGWTLPSQGWEDNWTDPKVGLKWDQ